MLVYVHGAKCIGIDAVPVTIEINITAGVGIHLVGLADAAVKESLLRTVTALQSRGFRIPGRKIVINLAPADMHKSGSGYDLPIALGIIAASGQRDLPLLGDYLIMGELGLDGSIRYVPGTLPMAELAERTGMEGCIFPEKAALEAADFGPVRTYAVKDLEEVLRILGGEEESEDLLVRNSALFRQRQEEQEDSAGDCPDMADIIGQDGAKRGLEIAAAGGHNLIMIGPPGSGKSSLAKAMAGILPPMTLEESTVTSKIYSVAGKNGRTAGLIRKRPFRAPHISASLPAMLGGGSGDNVMPGEVSLATGGVLFLDEFTEAPKAVVEALRGPMEDRKVVISRLKSKICYPASFILIAAANPCPCGYYGEGDRCRCSPGQIATYLGKLSGPLTDRLDLQVFVHSVPASELVSGRMNETRRERSAAIAERVARARNIQKERFSGEGIFTNAEMSNRQLDRFCPLSEPCRELLERLIGEMGLSARAYTRILKVARTIADLAGLPDILPEHLAEAASYRFLDRRNILDI